MNVRRAEPNFPVVTDTEAETSIDLELSFGDISRKAENTTTKRRSLFNLTVLKNSDNEARKSAEFKSFESYVNQEMNEWSELFTQLKNELRETKKGHSPIDSTILPEEKLKFLQAEPDVDLYLRNLHERHCFALKFLNNDFEDMMRLRQKISDVSKYKVQIGKQFKLNQLYCNNNVI